MFQKVVKISWKYRCGCHNGKNLTEKTFRVFASKRPDDTYIGKRKSAEATNEKFANTPDKCFICNESISGLPVPEYLDRQWYIQMALKRINEKFGGY